MGQLLFKKCFHPLIAQGRKRATIRRWVRCSLSAGQRVFSPGVGGLIIASCQMIQLDDLTDSDAAADGFDSLAELKSTLRRLYPQADCDGKHWYRIRFEVERKTPAAAPARAAKSANPSAARRRLASEVRAQLDKAVGRARSSAGL
jgi:hypothetical protein